MWYYNDRSERIITFSYVPSISHVVVVYYLVFFESDTEHCHQTYLYIGNINKSLNLGIEDNF